MIPCGRKRSVGKALGPKQGGLVNDSPNIRYWKEIQGGLRPSSLLRWAAPLIWLSVALHVADSVLYQSRGLDYRALGLSAWICWIATLSLLAAAFCLLGYRPFLTRIAWLAGLFHLAQAVDLFVVFFATQDAPYFLIVFIPLGKYISLVIFAVAEKKRIGKRMSWILGSIAGLEIVKIAALTVFDPSEGMSLPYDTILLATYGWAIFRLRHCVYDQEEHWARRRYNERSASFEDFDNPG
jgi:hypothetical protein